MEESVKPRKRQAKFRVRGRLGMAGGSLEGSVTIDREAGLFIVKPLRKREVYTMRLCDVADMVVAQVLLSGLREEQRARKAARKKKAA